jgi:hypothetical protein
VKLGHGPAVHTLSIHSAYIEHTLSIYCQREGKWRRLGELEDEGFWGKDELEDEGFLGEDELEDEGFGLSEAEMVLAATHAVPDA